MITLDKIDDLGSKLKDAVTSYDYQYELTDELDALNGDFTDTDILKIVLWKLNRYVGIGKELRASINNLRREYSADKAERVLRSLLACKGVNLPMASALLRFSVPHHLQIIDQRVYRILTGQLLKLPRSEDEKVEMYFSYIRLLHEKCEQFQIPFHKADQILYELDRKVNKSIKLSGYGHK